MANELYYTSSATVTPYAIIRRKSDGYAWNGSAFEAFTNGNVTTYDIALTSLGGDYWAASFPSSIDIGNYVVLVYDQAGGSPAITDVRLSSYLVYWNGSGTSTPSAGTGYTTLDRYKEYAGVTNTTNDAIYTTLIEVASKAIDAYCDRKFDSNSYTEYASGKRSYYSSFVRLRNYPVTSITRVASCPQEGISVSQSVAQAANVQVSSGNLILNRWNSGVLTTSTLSLTTYANLTTLAAAINALGNGWTATAHVSYYPSAFLKDMSGPMDAVSSSASLICFTEVLTSYQLDADTGSLRGHFPEGYQNVEIRYTGGYSEIPAAIQHAACEIIKTIYDLSKTDNAMKSERIGDYSYSVRDSIDSSDFTSSIPPVAKMLLAPYRNDMVL